MKNVIKTTVLLFAITSLIACKNDSKKDSNKSVSTDEIKTEAGLSFYENTIGEQFQHYIHIKKALVNSDLDEAKSGAIMLTNVTENGSLKDVAISISTAQDIETARMLFAEVTKKMTLIVNKSISTGEVYQQYCPMAFNNSGGYWLSTDKEIRNPYFGDRMLKCGSVTETIK